jgi:hypothetical protein
MSKKKKINSLKNTQQKMLNFQRTLREFSEIENGLIDKLDKTLGLNKTGFNRDFPNKKIGEILYDIYCLLRNEIADKNCAITNINDMLIDVRNSITEIGNRA